MAAKILFLRRLKDLANIAVNTRLLLKGKLDGINRFSFEVLRRLVKQFPEHTFYFLFDRRYDADFVFAENVKPVVLFPQARHPFLYVWWFEFSVKSWLNRNKPDLFLSPDGFLSLRASCKQVPVIHDLNFEHNPEMLPLLTRKYYQWFFPRFAKKANHIITVSEFSKKDLVETYGVREDKISVSCNGISEMFSPAQDEPVQSFKNKFKILDKYFICVGSIHQRKNPDGLILAFERVLHQYHDAQLVFAGGNYWGVQFLEDILKDKPWKDQVIFTGRLSDEEMVAAISGAVAMVYPSYFEGFGIPVLEAFACETPVVTSNVTSLPEVSGEAAILVDPTSVEQIGKAMITVLEQPDLAQKMVEEGKKQAEKYTWDNAAKAVAEVIQKELV